jgi:hypothetical protein
MMKPEMTVSREQRSERRSGGDRRNFMYTLHIPERRCGEDRRHTGIWIDPDTVAQMQREGMELLATILNTEEAA